MKHLYLAFLVCAVALSACTQPDISRFALDTPVTATAAKTRTTIEIRDVSLPLYAREQQIAFADPGGAIRSDNSSLWADTPSRAISFALAESLSNLTGAVVAVEPWPLDEPADVQLDVRVRTLLAASDGSLHFSGQYFVVFESGRSARSDWFDINIPTSGRSGQDIAQVTGAAVHELAKKVSAQIR